MKQKTIASTIQVAGLGIHSGVHCNLSLLPAEADTGILFCRTDLPDLPTIPALASHLSTTERSTSLKKGDVSVHTIEHLLAAIVGADIDNVRIEIDAAELPILDGSSKAFLELIRKAGMEEQDAEREYLVIDEVMTVTNGQSELMIVPSEEYSASVMVDYNSSMIHSQYASLDKIEDFEQEIAPSRTFCFLREIKPMIERKLIRGGSLDNAVVYVDEPVSKELEEELKSLVKNEVGKIELNSTLSSTPLHYPNEAARHKLLDLIGDLALVGKKIKGKIIAKQPGHYINTQLAKKIYDRTQSEDAGISHIDPTVPPLKDTIEVMRMLPHRPPFLFVDKIMELSDTHVIGVKNVTMGEPYFVGHFPNEPIMPGVLQMEALAQVGGILALSIVPDPENYITYFMKMNNAKFRQKVVPGDTLIFRLDLMSPLRRGICHMFGRVFVGGKVAAEAELMALVTKSQN